MSNDTHLKLGICKNAVARHESAIKMADAASNKTTNVLCLGKTARADTSHCEIKVNLGLAFTRRRSLKERTRLKSDRDGMCSVRQVSLVASVVCNVHTGNLCSLVLESYP